MFLFFPRILKPLEKSLRLLNQNISRFRIRRSKVTPRFPPREPEKSRIGKVDITEFDLL